MPEPANDASRQFLIAAIQHEHELISSEIRHERELREQAMEQRDWALSKQAEEYERRLGELNHAHAKANEDKQAFLLKITYENFIKEFDSWKLEIVQRFAAESARQMASGKLWAIMSSILTAVMGSLVIWFLMRGGAQPGLTP